MACSNPRERRRRAKNVITRKINERRLARDACVFPRCRVARPCVTLHSTNKQKKKKKKKQKRKKTEKSSCNTLNIHTRTHTYTKKRYRESKNFL